jgi:hypothetical protein
VGMGPDLDHLPHRPGAAGGRGGELGDALGSQAEGQGGGDRFRLRHLVVRGDLCRHPLRQDRRRGAGQGARPLAEAARQCPPVHLRRHDRAAGARLGRGGRRGHLGRFPRASCRSKAWPSSSPSPRRGRSPGLAA